MIWNKDCIQTLHLLLIIIHNNFCLFRFRIFCYQLCTHPYFVNSVLIMICISSLLLAAEDPLNIAKTRNQVRTYVTKLLLRTDMCPIFRKILVLPTKIPFGPSSNFIQYKGVHPGIITFLLFFPDWQTQFSGGSLYQKVFSLIRTNGSLIRT